jgi:hypothetical protein
VASGTLESGQPARWRLVIVFAVSWVAMVLLASPLGADAQCVTLADFSADSPGGFPRGWRVPRDDGYGVYRVVEEGGARFLRAVSRGVGTQALLEKRWDLGEYPVLAWRWRPRVFPDGGDERSSRTNDSALGVYVGWPRTPMAVRAVKYVWSRVAPAGLTAVASAGFTRMLVLRSGPGEPGRWVEERVNVVADFKRFFGAEPGRPRGIGVLTDADDTRSVAEGDYDDFRACRP